MSLIVEDGTGLSTAESYISVDDTSTYFSDRNVSDWAALTTSAQEAALRLATEYMTQRYRSSWMGLRYTEDQALDWPRQGVVLDSWSVDIDEIPVEVKRACAELALKASSDDLAPDLTQNEIKSVTDVLASEYNPYSPEETRYRVIDMMLAPLLNAFASGCCRKIVRT